MVRAVVPAAAAACINTPNSRSPQILAYSSKRRRLSQEDGMTNDASIGKRESRRQEESEEQRDEDARHYFSDYGSVTHLKSQGSGRVRGSPGASSDHGFNMGAHIGVDTDGSREAQGGVDEAEIKLNSTSPSYQSMIRSYFFVPLITFLTIVFFILLRWFLWPVQSGSSSVVSHFGLAILGAAVWTVSFTLRTPVYVVSSLICCSKPVFIPLVSASFQALVEEALRLSSLVLARIRLRDCLSPQDAAFSCIWTLALGWATAEVTVSITQGYGQLALYSDVMSLDGDSILSNRIARPFSVAEHPSAHNDANDSYCPVHDPAEALDQEIDQIIRIRARSELETLYGIPVPDIPVFVSCLLRIDSITLSIALFLIISSSYLRHRSPSPPDPMPDNVSEAIRDTLPTFFLIYVLRTCLSSIWTLNILPRIGLHAASYMSCIFALGALFVGFGRWDAI
ncbi:hypothetical protein K439DRAFT_1631658 [Ramaria rubella]|nr:hypothetical protein K439DRAFT_1631658 [Ramaria rubella]